MLNRNLSWVFVSSFDCTPLHTYVRIYLQYMYVRTLIWLPYVMVRVYVFKHHESELCVVLF